MGYSRHRFRSHDRLGLGRILRKLDSERRRCRSFNCVCDRRCHDLFIGLTYAELTAAMPQCGGEHVFSYKAMGPNGSFICTWAIILGYVSVTCFEACAFPTIITYLWPGFLKGYMYSVAGFDIYASWVAVAVIVAFLITLINVLGAKQQPFCRRSLPVSSAALVSF